ncbi:MAG TPA: hypothetical protein PK076_08940 [Saprospiraceae bacterium]|nr:hypothetical protein [Saprospiraceae bacterium]HQW56240.1 hypothetical protein [Saprospiraceae bacterium]
MFGRDSLTLGIVTGVIFPVVGYGLLLLIKESLIKGGVLPPIYDTMTSITRTIGVLAICFNLILIQVFNARRYDKSIRGLVFPTLLFVLIWFYMYGSHLFKQI